MITADSLIPTIKKLAVSYLDEIGSNETGQNSYIFIYLTNALRKLAGIANVTKISDVLTISADGFVTFLQSGTAISNMYAPLRILNSNGEARKRTSFSESTGWYRESFNTQIHVKGMNGDYTLQYVAYPATISQTTSVVEFPDAGTMGLAYYTAALIIESVADQDKQLVDHYYSLSEKHLKVAVQANLDARGQTSGGYVPSISSVDAVFKG